MGNPAATIATVHADTNTAPAYTAIDSDNADSGTDISVVFRAARNTPGSAIHALDDCGHIVAADVGAARDTGGRGGHFPGRSRTDFALLYRNGGHYETLLVARAMNYVLRGDEENNAREREHGHDYSVGPGAPVVQAQTGGHKVAEARCTVWVGFKRVTRTGSSGTTSSVSQTSAAIVGRRCGLSTNHTFICTCCF